MKEIFTRTSVRQFEEKEVEQEKVEQLLRAAMQAPTAGNQQPWVFYVVKSKETLEKLSQASPYAGCVKNAPIAIVIGYREDVRFAEMAEIDCAIATENIYLEATTLGLGTTMMGIAPVPERMKAVEDALNLPEDIHAFTILPIGYPKKVNAQPDRFDENKIFYVD